MSNERRPPIPTADVAKQLGVTPKTVARWAADGTLPPLTKLDGLRGPFLFDPNAVDALAKDRETAKAAS